MAQFSVPSSEIDYQPSAGVTLVPVNGANRIDVVDDSAQNKYLHAANTDAINGDTARITYGMQALIDPLVDTDHKVHVVIRGPIGALATITLALTDVLLSYLWIKQLHTADLTGSFVELIYTLQAAEVQAIRAASAYPSLYFFIETALGPLETTDIAFIQFEVPAASAQSWWYKASTDEYKYQADSPGAGYVETTPPVMKAYGKENPIQGVSTGGTPIIISGDGFASGLTVTFAGVSATSIVVVNQHTITCNTPAFGGALSTTQIVDVGNGVMKSANVASATVTVTNPDGQSASM